MHPPQRRIAHLDMDAFYASVERLRRPELAGLPLVIGGRAAAGELRRLGEYTGRGVVTTATYEARALGVSSGMGLMQAARRAPDALLLAPDFEAYRAVSRRFKAAVARIAPCIEDRGIDEIFIDLSAVPGSSSHLAQRIKAAVREATGLTCSIGIAPNRLLAKLCSDLDKPDGLTLLAAREIPGRIHPLPVDKVNGIGPKATQRLAQLGVHTLGELAACAPQWLHRHFGPRYGDFLRRAAHGIDDTPVVTRTDPRSVSRETTFERDLHPRHDRQQLNRTFAHLCRRVAADLERKGVWGRTIGVKLRYPDFHTLTRDLTLPEPTRDPQRIRRAAGECLRRAAPGERLRLLGVRVSGLTRAPQPAPRQLELDWPPSGEAA